MNKIIISLSLLVLLLVGIALAAAVSSPDASAQSQAKCYIQNGAATVVASSGCSYVFESGSNFSVSAGATLDLPSSVLSGAGVVRMATPMICKQGRTTITDTVAYTSTVTAITTPAWSSCTLDTITGDAASCASSVGTPGAVSLIVRNSAATPAANSSGAIVNWEVCGIQ